jgi:hypothetical protein
MYLEELVGGALSMVGKNVIWKPRSVGTDFGGFSRRTSNECSVAPAWPNSAATTENEKANQNKRVMERKKERRTVSTICSRFSSTTLFVMRSFTGSQFSHGLLWSEGESHKQRVYPVFLEVGV